MSGWFERRRLAKEEARQRAVDNDLAANDLITLLGPPKPRPRPDATPGPAPVAPPRAVPPPVADDPVTQADSPSPWAAPVQQPDPDPVSQPDPVEVPATPASPAPGPDADRTAVPTATDADSTCRQLLELPGALAAAVIDANGMSLAAHGDAGFDLDAGTAAAGEVVLAHRDLLGEDRITDAVITTGRRHLLLAAAGPSADGLLVYLVLDSRRGNLATARRRLTQLAAGLTA